MLMTMAGAIDDEDQSHCMVTVMIAVDADDKVWNDYSVGDMPVAREDVDNKRCNPPACFAQRSMPRLPTLPFCVLYLSFQSCCVRDICTHIQDQNEHVDSLYLHALLG